MKKLFSLKLTGVAILLAGLMGCNDILENVEPPTSVSFEVALSNADAVLAVRASMYSAMRASFDYTTQLMIGPGALADETYNRPGSTRFNNLNEAIGTSGTVHLTAFGSSYGIIRNANLLIGGIQPGAVTDAQANQFRGEALAIRSFAYFNLARTYGYEPGRTGMGPQANWNQSAILRLVPTLDIAQAAPQARATVDEVYAQILSDLAEAKTLLAGQNANNAYVTEAFIDGLRARVNLYAGNWAAAATAAQAAISNSGRSLVNTAAGVNTMFNQRNPEALFEIVVNPNTEPIGGNNTNDGLAAYTSIQWVAQVPTNAVVSLYDAADFRLLGWYDDCVTAQRGLGAAAVGCDAINTISSSLTKWNGYKGNLADDIPYMRVGEMYLIWAEAAAKAANSPASGQTPLQALRDARNAGPIPASALTSMQAFEDFILQERMRELIGEGHRFYDLKRLGRDIPNRNGTIKIRADSYRILAPFGTGAQNVNPLLVENPGYVSVN
jgi:starch-binding outer membrane protein, SusD/RagB family